MSYRDYKAPKYDASLRPSEIIKLIRADLKQLVKDEKLPKGIKLSVRKSDYNAFRIEVKEFPSIVKNPNYNNAIYNNEPYYNKEAQEALELIDDTADAYNFDKSDPMTDYFHVNYYCFSSFDYDLIHSQKIA